MGYFQNQPKVDEQVSSSLQKETTAAHRSIAELQAPSRLYEQGMNAKDRFNSTVPAISLGFSIRFGGPEGTPAQVEQNGTLKTLATFGNILNAVGVSEKVTAPLTKPAELIDKLVAKTGAEVVDKLPVQITHSEQHVRSVDAWSSAYNLLVKSGQIEKNSQINTESEKAVAAMMFLGKEILATSGVKPEKLEDPKVQKALVDTLLNSPPTIERFAERIIDSVFLGNSVPRISGSVEIINGQLSLMDPKKYVQDFKSELKSSLVK